MKLHKRTYSLNIPLNGRQKQLMLSTWYYKKNLKTTALPLFYHNPQ